jgi:lysozyme family protein
MQSTYEQAITQVFKDEGGYSNDPGDSGGPTNWGITIHDARMYWKPDATADDVRNMPKSVAEEIYAKHYALPLHYNDLPAGVDYAVLDYGINSGISRAAKVLQTIVGVPADGVIGPVTLEAVSKIDASTVRDVIDKIYNERLAFLQRLNKPQFIRGWTNRCHNGRLFAYTLAKWTVNDGKPKTVPEAPLHPIQIPTAPINPFVLFFQLILKLFKGNK